MDGRTIEVDEDNNNNKRSQRKTEVTFKILLSSFPVAMPVVWDWGERTNRPQSSYSRPLPTYYSFETCILSSDRVVQNRRLTAAATVQSQRSIKIWRKWITMDPTDSHSCLYSTRFDVISDHWSVECESRFWSQYTAQINNKWWHEDERRTFLGSDMHTSIL